MKATLLIDLFHRSRNNNELAVIEGVQALKHAARFNAKFEKIVTSDKAQLEIFLDELAPDMKELIISQTEEIGEEAFIKLSPQPPRTKVIAVAQRKKYTLEDIEVSKPVVLLEDPRDLENIGAVIRVSAAADVAAVCITGAATIWHPAVIRGGAGLHYAVPVFNLDSSSLQNILAQRKLVALDPTGKDISTAKIPSSAILLFGTERHGISQALLTKSDEIVRLPMKQGVSSLNLATSVAATLYQL